MTNYTQQVNHFAAINRMIKLAEELEAHKVAEPKPSTIEDIAKVQEGKGATESTATQKKQNPILKKQKAQEKVLSVNKNSILSWADVMKNVGVDINEFENFATNKLKENFIPNTTNVQYPEIIPETKWQQKMAAQQEVDRNTRDIDQKIQTTKDRIIEEETNRRVALLQVETGLPVSDVDKDTIRTLAEQHAEDSTEVQQLKQQRANVEKAIRQQIDPDYVAEDIFEMFATPKLSDINSVLQDQLDTYRAINTNFKAGISSDAQRKDAAEQLMNTRDLLDKTIARYSTLNSYIKHVGLPDSFDKVPDHLKPILTELAPGIESNPEYMKYLKDYITEHALDKRKERALLAGNSAKQLRDVVFNQEQLQTMQDNISTMIEATDLLSGAESLRNTKDAFTLASGAGQYLNRNARQLSEYYDPTYKNYEEAQRILNKAKRYQELGLKVKATNKFWDENSGNIRNMGYAVKEWAIQQVEDPLGFVELNSTFNQLDLMKKINSGEKLSSSELSLMDALALNQVIHDKYQDLEDVNAYKYANIAANSLRFMAEFMVGNSALRAISKAGTKGAVKSATAKVADFLSGELGKSMRAKVAYQGMESLGREGVKSTMLQYLHKTPGFLTQAAGDAVNALLLEGTVQLPRTMSDVNNLRLGRVDYEQDEEGNVTSTGYTDGLSLGRALYTGVTRDWVENFSEQMGEWGIGSLVGKPFAWLGKGAMKKVPSGVAIALSNSAEKLANSKLARLAKETFSYTKGFREALAAGEFHGVLGETAEEYYGMALLHLMGVSDSDKNFWDDITSKDNFMDIFGGIALSTAFLGTFGVATHLQTKHKYDSAKSEAKKHFGDRWDRIEQAIVMSDQKNLPLLMTSLTKIYNSEDDIDQLLRYYDALERYRGSSYAAQAMYDDNMKSIYKLTLDESRRTGYSAHSILFRKDIDRSIKIAEAELQRQYGVEDISEIQQYIQNQGGTQAFVRSHDVSKEQRYALYVYENLLEMQEGSNERLAYDQQNILQQIDRGVQRVTFKSNDPNISDKVINVTIKDKDGKKSEAFIVRGDFEYKEIPGGTKDEDGQTVPAYTHKANGEITVRDKDGFLKTINAEDIVDVNTVADASMMSVMGQMEALRQNLLTNRRVEANRGFKFGDKYELANGDILTTISASNDGGVLYTIKDKNTGEEHLYSADSNQTMNQIIEDALTDRANKVYDKVWEMIQLQRKEEQAAVTNPEAVVEVDDTVNKAMLERAEESAKPVTSHIKVGNKSNSFQNSKRTWTKVKQSIKELKSAKSFDEFKEILKKNKTDVADKHEGRLNALYKAFSSGNISQAQFAAVFIPEQFRNKFLNKEQMRQFNALEIDADGIVTTIRKPKVVKPTRTVDISMSPEYLIEDEENAPKREIDISMSPEYLIDEDEPESKRTVDISAQPEYLFEDDELPEDASPAPVATNAGSAEANNDEKRTKQQQSLDKLTDKITRDAKDVHREWTSSFHYFINKDGKITLKRRVHTAIGDQYEPVAGKNEKIQELISELKNLYNSDKKAFEKRVKELAGDLKMDGYFQYLSQENADVDEAIEGIATSLSDIKKSPSINYGNLLDDISRKLFGNILFTYEDYQDIVSKEVFDDIVRQAVAIQKIFNQRGWKVVTTPVVFSSTFYDTNTGKTVDIAGETDMIAIDQNGHYHILDFKTSYKNFTSEIFDTIPSRKLDGYRSALRSTRDQYSMQQTMYQLMVQDNLDGLVDSIEIIPWTLKYHYNGPFKLEGAKNEISGVPQFISLISSNSILERFIPVNQSIIYELLDSLNKLTDWIQDRIQMLEEVLDQSSELIDDEIKSLRANLGDLLDNYNTLIESGSNNINDLIAAHDVSERVLSSISEILETISIKSQERANSIAASQQQVITPEQTPATVEDELPEQGSEEWKQKTTTYKNSSGRFIGIEDAVAEDNPNLKLKNVTGNADFITNATFKFIMKDGRVHVQIIYDGHIYLPVSVHTGDNNQGRIFFRNVKSFFAKLTSGKILVQSLKPSRTNGRIKSGTRGSLVDKGLIVTDRSSSGIYLYDVQLASSDGTFGVVVEEGGQKILTVPGQTRQSRDRILTLKEGSNMSEGSVAMIVRRPYDELPVDKQPRVPLFTYNAKMTDGDVDLITGILSGEYCRDKNVSRAGILNLVFYENGVDKGLTNELVLNMLIAYGSYNRKDRPHVHIELDNNNGNIIRVVGNVSGDPADEIAVRSFDFSTSNGIEDFRTFLKENVNKNLDQNLMSQRLGNITDKSSLLYGLKKFFDSRNGQRIVLQHGALKFGNSSIVFDAKDFKDETNPSDNEGLSGLGWYIRHGFIETDFEGFENTLLEFDHNAPFEVVDEQQVQQQPKSVEQLIDEGIQNAQQNGVEELDLLNDISDDIDDDDIGLRLKTVKEKDASGTIDVEAAKKELRRILGNDVDITIFDGLIKRFSGGIAAVGACYKDAIWLSKMATKGTEYHEAFHRVTDVVFSKKERERAYRIWRNAKKLKNFTDVQVSEGMADDFVYFVENRPTFKASWKIFKSIYDYIKGIEKIGGLRLFWIYRNVYKGKYANRKPSDEALLKSAFDVRYKLTKRGSTFNEIVTQHLYNVLINSFAGILLNPETQTIKWDGSNIADLKIDKDTLIKSKAFKYYYKNATPETQNAIRELIIHWDAVEPDIATYVSTFATDFKVRYEDQSDASREGSSSEVPVIDNTGDVDDNDDFDEEIASASNEEHMKASYEFSQFSRTSAKVKFFFSGIIKSTWAKNKEGEVVKVPIVNEFGLPELLDTKYVFSEVLSELHDCTSVTEFRKRLNNLGVQNSIYNTISERFEELYNQAYPKDGPVDYDAELVIVQIFSTIRAQKNNFEIVKSTKNNLGGNTLRVFQSDAGHSARNYTEDWSTQFAAGASAYIKQDENGHYVMKDKWSPGVFSAIYERFYGAFGMSFVYSTEGRTTTDASKKNKFVIDEIAIDVNNPSHVELTKRNICRFLRTMGIIFEKDVFDYMLLHRYGNTGVDAMTKFIQDRSESSFFSFCKFVKGFLIGDKLNLSTKDGVDFINGANVNKVFNKNGFIKELANWKYAYRTAHDQLSVLATNNNKYYVISQNNIMSDRLSELEKGGNERDQLFDTPYVLTELDDGTLVGSLMAKHVLENGHTPLKMATLAGFRTDAKDDQGIDYATINRREDYIAKMTILQHRVTDPATGQVSSPILFPTLSDKKTWCYIYGVFLPGINFANVVADTKYNGNAIEPFMDSVVDQFLEYAITEDRSVRLVLDTVNSLSEEKKVVNFHVGKEITDKLGAKYTTIQGARYSSLLGVYVNEKGKEVFKEFNRVLDENGVYYSEDQNYKDAHKYFFDPQLANDNGVIRMETPEETLQRQRSQIRKLLEELVKNELEYAADLGLIEKIGNSGNPMYDYRNVGLDSLLIYSIEQLLKGGRNTGIEENKQIHSTAVYLAISDTMTRHMMSIQEVERIFAGNPSAFKFTYDDDGHLIDRTTDQQKRLGGLVSTGQNNVEVPGVPEYYTTAEVDNQMIQSEDFEHIANVNYRGLLVSTAIRQYLTRKFKTFDNIDDYDKSEIKVIEGMSNEELELQLDPAILQIVEKISKTKSDAFRKSKEEHLDGIDVADGGSFITDKMCENLLRMAGSFNNDVAKAFKVLRGEKVDGKVYTVKDIYEIAKAYQLIMTTVIGTQKYTAYGFRYVNKCAVPYYNKTALFPLFKNICTGKMAKIYKKMLDDGVDMLMVNSSVKNGSLGSKSDDWNDPNIDFNDPNGFHFNSYKLKYAYLRKQFNTDPKEKELMSMGTQMTKIVMSTLIPGRTYDVGGVEMDATQLRDHIRQQLNTLSDEGVKEIKEMFFEDDGSFSIEKFSTTLTKELQGRGASAEMLDAVSVVERNGHKELKLPLAALSGMNWIQSIIKSMVDKRVVDTNTPGKAFYQRSVWNMEGPTTVLDDKDLPKSINNGNRLLMLNEEGSMDCVLSIDYFEDVLKQAKIKTGRKVKKTIKKKRLEHPKVTKYGSTTEDITRTVEVEYEEEIEVDETVSVSTLSFEEQKQWLIDHDIISGMKNGEWHNATASIIGYRIPTQAISSIHALRCVDVLPTVRDTIILPAEFTKITGSDFDIDKVFLSTMFRMANGSTEFENDLAKKSANELIKAYIAILKDTDRSMTELNGSIDNDTELIKEVVKDIFGKESVALRSYDAYTMRSQFSSKDEFINGKRGIGPFALNNNNHILTMLYGVEFKQGNHNILEELGLTSLHESSDKDGNSIMSWLSGFINAHVDVAKDPYISKLNVNPYTYNLVNLLIRTGYGKDTLYFTSQPIMRQLAEAYANATGKYMVDALKSQTKAVEEAEEAVLLNLINSYLGTQYATSEEAISTWIKSRFNLTDPNTLITPLLKDNAWIIRDIAKRKVKDVVADSMLYSILINDTTQVDLTTADVQIIVALANLKFKPYTNALSELVKYSKIDTKKEGKSIIEQIKYLEGYEGIFDPQKASKTRFLFNTQSLDRMAHGSYIHTKTTNAINTFNSILGQLLIEATNMFQLEMLMLLSMCTSLKEHTTKDLKSIVNQLLAKIKSDFFFGANGYAQKLGTDVKGLITGNNTIYDRLLSIKVDLVSDPKYADMVDSDGNPLNYLLRNLVSGKKYEFVMPTKPAKGTLADTYDHAKFILPLSFMNDETINADELSQAWEDLLTDTAHPELLRFAQDLIIYAFITSGDNGGRMDIFKYIPNSWKLGIPELGESYEGSYSEYMINALNDYKAGRGHMHSSDYEDIVLNNWHDDRYVPTVYPTKGKQQLFENWMSDPVGGFPIILGGISPSGKAFDSKAQFIKMKRQHISGEVNGQREYTIYKRIGYGVRTIMGEKNGKPVVVRRTTYPVYVMVDPQGIKFSTTELVLGYGQPLTSESRQIVEDRLGEIIKVINMAGGNIQQGDLESTIQQIIDFVDNKGIKVIKPLMDVGLPADLAKFLGDMVTGEESAPSAQVEVSSVMYYSGNIIPEANTIFVFGSNTEGRHGKGSAKVATDMFGAQYGVSEGITGQAYALPTKDLAKGERSLTKDLIVENIRHMYEAAKANPTLNFKVAYRNMPDEKSLNGYTGREMIEMFKEAGPIPSNVWFSQEWVNTGLFDQQLTQEVQSVAAEGTYAVPPSADKSIINNPLNLYTYSRYPEGKPNYEVSSKGDSRFSAMYAKFAEGTKLLGHDVGGRTIESVYQHGVKQGDWVTDNNNKTGAPKDKTIIKGNTEDDSYTQGYLPLWREWARQNPQLIEELRRNASGKVLTDMFASTKVSQARALADILNQTANIEDRPLPKFNGISELDVRRAISLIRNQLEHAEGVVDQILYNARYRGMSEQDRQDLYKYQQIVDKCILLLNGLYDGSSEVIINEYNVPQVVLKQTTQSTEADLFDQFVRDNSNWDNPDEFSDEEMNHCP